MSRRFLAILSLGFLASGCAAPRSVLWDGTTMPRGHFQGNLGFAGCVPTATMDALAASQMDAAKSMLGGGEDSIANEAAYRDALKSVVAAGLDMPGVNSSLGLSVGIGWRTELGYRREGGVNAWSLRRQILDAEQSGWNGGVGIQYSSQTYELPSALGKVQTTLGYRFDRKDVLVPVVFSKPFGPAGIYGSGAIGVVGGWTRINYGFDPKGLYRTWGGQVSMLERLPDQESSFFSYGVNGFLRGGYKHTWAFVGLTAYYQDYGAYTVPGTAAVELSGLSLLPVVGLELRI